MTIAHLSSTSIPTLNPLENSLSYFATAAKPPTKTHEKGLPSAWIRDYPRLIIDEITEYMVGNYLNYRNECSKGAFNILRLPKLNAHFLKSIQGQ